MRQLTKTMLLDRDLVIDKPVFALQPIEKTVAIEDRNVCRLLEVLTIARDYAIGTDILCRCIKKIILGIIPCRLKHGVDLIDSCWMDLDELPQASKLI